MLIISPDDMLNYKKIYRALGKDEEEVSMFPVQNKCMDVIKVTSFDIGCCWFFFSDMLCLVNIIPVYIQRRGWAWPEKLRR